MKKFVQTSQEQPECQAAARAEKICNPLNSNINLEIFKNTLFAAVARKVSKLVNNPEIFS